MKKYRIKISDSTPEILEGIDLPQGELITIEQIETHLLMTLCKTVEELYKNGYIWVNTDKISSLCYHVMARCKNMVNTGEIQIQLNIEAEILSDETWVLYNAIFTEEGEYIRTAEFAETSSREEIIAAYNKYSEKFNQEKRSKNKCYLFYKRVQ